MTARRRTTLIAAVLGLGAAVLALVVLSWKGAPKQRVEARYRADGTEALGALALAELLCMWGIDVVRHGYPYDHLREPGVLVCVEPTGNDTGPDRRQVRSLLRWVRRGNLLILAASRSGLLHEALGVEVGGQVRDGAEVGWRAVRGVPMLAGARAPLASRTSSLRLPTSAYPLYTCGESVVAGYVPLGAGEAIVLGSSQVALNDGLLAGDVPVLWRNLARYLFAGRRVFFDDYHHGHVLPADFSAYFARTGVSALLLAHLALLGALVLVRTRTRTGRIVRPDQERSRESVETIRAEAGLLQEAGHVHMVLRSLIGELDRAAGRAVPGAREPDGRLIPERMQAAAGFPFKEYVRVRGALAATPYAASSERLLARLGRHVALLLKRLESARVRAQPAGSRGSPPAFERSRIENRELGHP